MVYVKPYIKRDGTKVRGYIRRFPTPNGPGMAGISGLAVLLLAGLALWAFGTSGGSTTEPGTAASWDVDGFTVHEVNNSRDTDCGLNSYGAVPEFFTQHPCVGLQRKLLKADDGEGNLVLIATSRTEMPTPDEADLLRQLVDGPGTGNVADLARVTPGYTGIRFTGRYYASSAMDTTVQIAETEPLAGSPSAGTMRRLARSALEHQ